MDKAKLRQYARDLRKNSTDAEKHLWYNLRANRMGYKFKRQVPIESFIVDFACIEKRLIIELDGGQHQENQAYDAHRTTELSKRGFQVLRFWNHDVLQQSEAVIEMIFKALSPALLYGLDRIVKRSIVFFALNGVLPYCFPQKKRMKTTLFIPYLPHGISKIAREVFRFYKLWARFLNAQ